MYSGKTHGFGGNIQALFLPVREHSSARAEVSAWSVMQHEGVSVLLASAGPALNIPTLPLLFYFFYDDIEAVVGVLEGAGVPVVRTGHPPHALGGEVKVLDPDGNTVLLAAPSATPTTRLPTISVAVQTRIRGRAISRLDWSPSASMVCSWSSAS